jgi:hypothetical protein
LEKEPFGRQIEMPAKAAAALGFNPIRVGDKNHKLL